MFKEIVAELARQNIINITDNSKFANTNTAFFCNEKAKEKGFDLDALNKGCKVVLYISTKGSVATVNGIANINFPSWNEYVSFLQQFFNTQKILKVGITGTNGKTSTAHFGASMYSASKGKSATIGTNGICIYENGKLLTTRETDLTTPTCTQCHSAIASMQNNGIECVFVEVSSIGLHQGRVDGILFDVAAFTNLTQDHLDYHSTMEKYFNQKLRLFTEFLKPNGTSVLNTQSEYSEQIENSIPHTKTLHYGTESYTENTEGFTVDFNGTPVAFPVHGRFQIQNLMCAVKALVAIGVDLHSLLSVIPKLTSPNGRMQGYAFQGKNIIIDFAHTPDALANVLQSITGYKIAVFGCGGSRDKTKRPLMGEIASRFSNFAIITNDNPRHEDAQAIANEIHQGFEGSHCKIILDRTHAIKEAISLCPVGGSIIIAGKGSEPYQIIGDIKTPYSDFTVIQNIISENS